MSKNGGVIGVSDHGGWAVLVTAAHDGTLLDRRRVELVDEDLPKIPHHSEGQALPLHEAVALVERVRVSAERRAKLGLDAVAMTVPGGHPRRHASPVPTASAHDCRADQGLPGAKRGRLGDVPQGASRREARGWAVHWYDAKNVFDAASEALHIEDLDAHFLKVRTAVGPPWNKDHKLAMAAAIATASAVVSEPRNLQYGRFK